MDAVSEWGELQDRFPALGVHHSITVVVLLIFRCSGVFQCDLCGYWSAHPFHQGQVVEKPISDFIPGGHRINGSSSSGVCRHSHSVICSRMRGSRDAESNKEHQS